MICHYCKAEIDDAATVCMHCRKKTTRSRQDAGDRTFNRMFMIVVVVIVGVVGTLYVSYHKEVPIQDRIRESCKAQYPYDEGDAAKCEIVLYTKELDRQQADRLNSAARQSGVR